MLNILLVLKNYSATYAILKNCCNLYTYDCKGSKIENIEKLDNSTCDFIDVIILNDNSKKDMIEYLVNSFTGNKLIYLFSSLKFKIINDKCIFHNYIKLDKIISFFNVENKIDDKNPLTSKISKHSNNNPPNNEVNKPLSKPHNNAFNKPQIQNDINKTKFHNLCLTMVDKFRNISIPEITLNKSNEAVLIEYRPLEHTEILLRNCISKLGDNWSYTIICGEEAFEFYTKLCNNIHKNIKVINTGHQNMDQNAYNNFLLTKDFWNLLTGEKILIYQEDTFIFKDNINDFMEWDYIGAPFKIDCVEGNNVGNGGLSLRSKSKMIEVLDQIPLESINKHEFKHFVQKYIFNKKLDNIPEDIYYSTYLQKLNIGKVPDVEIAKQFSSETIYNPDSFGMHCMWYGCKNWENNINFVKRISEDTIKKYIQNGYDENYLSKINEYCELTGIKIELVLDNRKEEFRYFCYRYLDYIRCLDLPFIKKESYYEAVLIEYRCLPNLEFLIRNCIHKLGSKWSQTIVCGNLNYNYMLNIVKKIDRDIKIIKTDFDNLFPSEYSLFLSSDKFWNFFSGEKILIYQEDTIILKRNIDDFLKWDYIGAPWNKNQNDTPNCVGNGGLSLRTKSIMLNIISKINIHETKYNSSTLNYMKNNNLSCPPEDVYFSKNMQELNIGKVADWNSAFDFSTENYLNENSFGCHGTWVYLEYNKEIWKKMLYDKIIKKNCFIITNNFCGGSNQYIKSLLNDYSDILNFICIKNRFEMLNYQYFKENDILLLQTLFFSDIEIIDIINIKQKFKLKLYLCIHDFYWLNKDILRTFAVKKIPWHCNYLEANCNINRNIYDLFKNCEIIIHPSKFTYNEYSKYFENNNFKIISHNDFINVNKLINMPKINNTINICCITSFSEYKGSEIMLYLYNNIKSYQNYNITYHIYGYNLNTYNENDNIYDILKEKSIHGLLFLNKYGETWSYALTKGLCSNLPIFYNNFGSFKERINESYGRIVCFHHESDYYNYKLCEIQYNKFLNFLIEHDKNNSTLNIENNYFYNKSHMYEQIFTNNLCLNKNILVYGHVNFLKNSSGNELRILRFIQYLKQYYNVYYYLTNSNENILCDYVYNKYKCKDRKANNSNYLSENIKNNAFKLAYKYNFITNDDINNILNLMNDKNINVLICEYIFNAFLFNYINYPCLKIIDTHDKMSNKPLDNPIYINEKEEVEVLNTSDAILAITENDKTDFLKNNLNSQVILTKINYIADKPISEKKINKEKYIFICATSNEFNIKCINEFIDKCWINIKTNVKLFVSGTICDKININNIDNIKLLGVLDYKEMINHIQNSIFCLNPVYIGTGLKVKTLTYIENEKFVLGFEECFKGIDYPIQVKDGDWTEYFNKLEEILANLSVLNEYKYYAINLIKANSDDLIYKDLVEYINKN